LILNFDPISTEALQSTLNDLIQQTSMASSDALRLKERNNEFWSWFDDWTHWGEHHG